MMQWIRFASIVSPNWHIHTSLSSLFYFQKLYVIDAETNIWYENQIWYMKIGFDKSSDMKIKLRLFFLFPIILTLSKIHWLLNLEKYTNQLTLNRPGPNPTYSVRGDLIRPSNPDSTIFIERWNFIHLFHTKFHFQQLLFSGQCRKNHFLDNFFTNKDLPYTSFTFKNWAFRHTTVVQKLIFQRS